MTVSLPIPATWDSVQKTKNDFPEISDEIDRMIEDKEIVIEGVKNGSKN